MRGEKMLLLAVLTQAFCDYHDARRALVKARRRKDPTSEQRWQWEVDLLERWFNGASARIDFSLCCDVLDIEQKRTAEKLKSVHVWRLYRRSVAEGKPKSRAIVAALEGEIRRRERLKRVALAAQLEAQSYGGLA